MREPGSRLEELLVLIEDKISKETRKEIEAYVLFDSLTGAYNRGTFDQHLSLCVRRAERSGGKFALYLLDIDNFKQYNDTFGHPRGDKVLRLVARALSPRETDPKAYRYGGEEFAVIIENPDDDPMQIGERFRQRIQAETPVTASIGLAIYSILIPVKVDQSDVPAYITRHVSSAVDLLIQDADCALYEAKSAGRNRMVCSNDRKMEAESRILVSG
jgi:diguanylate cyclase (GGDEF)-like protein